MDRRTRKRLELLQQRLRTLRQQLAGEKRQQDDPRTIKRLQEEIQALELEISRLRQGKNNSG